MTGSQTATVIDVPVRLDYANTVRSFACVTMTVSQQPLSLRAYAVMMSRGLAACIIGHQRCLSFITSSVPHNHSNTRQMKHLHIGATC